MFRAVRQRELSIGSDRACGAQEQAVQTQGPGLVEDQVAIRTVVDAVPIIDVTDNTRKHAIDALILGLQQTTHLNDPRPERLHPPSLLDGHPLIR